MGFLLFSGTANLALAGAIADSAGIPLGRAEIETFPDGELHVTVAESVRGRDVYLLQPTPAPAERHIFELLLLADACRRGGAERVTGVLPYVGYARQDRRTAPGEAPAARVMADVLATGRFHRLVAIDLHSAALEGFFPIPLEHLSAVPVLVQALRERGVRPGVVVAPDLGAAKLAERYAGLLELPVAIVHKTRLSGAEVRVRQISGAVRGLAPLIVDDMISTGGTISAAVAALRDAGSESEIIVAATHALLVGPARERLAQASLASLFVTDSVLGGRVPGLPLHCVSVAPLLAQVLTRLHDDTPLEGFSITD
ncbi:MAG TPA: ribose-phosphate pyrophosphokinase [Gemmatimonadales bacterium]|nr:ribose-phosphate pyrophosphokinase [Gemmatimonadales bacterium]